MITVYVDITAPLYWWKEFDTYKVGTVANSCSTMHKIHEKEFTIEDFSCEHLITDHIGRLSCTSIDILTNTIEALNHYREYYLSIKKQRVPGADVKAKRLWWQMIQLLPSSYNQKRTVMLSYEVLSNIYCWRKVHKLDEWREFCKWIEQLPYSEIITGEENCDPEKPKMLSLAEKKERVEQSLSMFAAEYELSFSMIRCDDCNDTNRYYNCRFYDGVVHHIPVVDMVDIASITSDQVKELMSRVCGMFGKEFTKVPYIPIL
jgi:hypothetical protein